MEEKDKISITSELKTPLIRLINHEFNYIFFANKDIGNQLFSDKKIYMRDADFAYNVDLYGDETNKDLYHILLTFETKEFLSYKIKIGIIGHYTIERSLILKRLESFLEKCGNEKEKEAYFNSFIISQCPALLYSCSRQLVSQLSMGSGLPEIVLPTVYF